MLFIKSWTAASCPGAMTPPKLESVSGLTVNLGGDDIVFLMSYEICSQSAAPRRIISTACSAEPLSSSRGGGVVQNQLVAADR